VLAAGLRTADIAGPNGKPVSTSEMGDAILAELKTTLG
jgi:3-isopropylmalate dehydrogenase